MADEQGRQSRLQEDLAGRCARVFRDPDAAAAEIARVARGDRQRAVRLATFLAAAPDPEGALRQLDRFGRTFKLPGSHEDLRSLILLLSHSSYLADVLHADREALAAALGGRRRPGAPAPESYRSGLARFLEGQPDSKRWALLRGYKDRQIVAIALRDFLREWSLPEVTEQLSFLADAILSEAIDTALRQTSEAYGSPFGFDRSGRPQRATLALIALGKLGGLELNYSSDVDLLLVYSFDGETDGASGDPGSIISNKEYFTRVAETFTRGLTEPEGGGWTLRVDWGLRPGGKDGDLALPVGATLGYYRTWGRPWERQALIKARPCAGDLRLGGRLVTQLLGLVYPASPDTGATDAIRNMKDLIDASLVRRGRAASDLKLGRGGIREIEFNVQGRQILHAGSDPWLRDPNSLRALHRLAEKGHISRADHAALTDAYRFLREAEHRIQIRQNLQRSTLPTTKGELIVLARSMGYGDDPPGRAVESFLADLDRHRGEVRLLYDEFLASQSQKRLELVAAPDPFVDPMGDAEVIHALEEAGWPDAGSLAAGVIRAARHIAPPAVPVENRRSFRQVTPVILRELPSVASPARALHNLERLLEGLAMDAAGMRAFVERPERFGPILRLFGGSQPLSDLLIHRPSLMLDPALDRALARDRTLSAHVSALRERVRRCRSFAEALAALRRYQQGELLLIGLKDVNRQITIRAVRRALSDLAEASVRGAWAAAAARLRREGGERPSPMAVLGLGRLGYREMDYGSDLDLVFVYDSAEDDARTHANVCTFATFVVEALDTITREGPLYAVDSRLRPFGSEGELAQSQRTLVAYLEAPAGVWEMQSYLKARPVAGDLRFGDRIARRAEQAILERASRHDPAPEIRSMRERLMEAAGAGGEDLKSGRGGTHAVQFALHYLQLSRHVASPHGKSTARLMRHLRDTDVLDEKSYTAFYRGERFLRRMEHQLRLLHGRSVTRVPGSTDRLAEVARGLDYRGPAGKAVAKMLRDLEATRRAVESAFDSVVPPESPRRH